MYYPYFRGKQFELITIRETSSLLAESNFVPIIEPVKESLGGLGKTLVSICDAGGKAIVIVNPQHGDHRETGVDISKVIHKMKNGYESISAGILLRNESTLDETISLIKNQKFNSFALIHAGFVDAKTLALAIQNTNHKHYNVFFEIHANTLYRKHFQKAPRILIRDGFKRQRNADYPPVEAFSDLHVTFKEFGMTGFGDFLIVGDNYSESGGPAYAVAIHLTFIDEDKDDEMCIYHFVSDEKDTPTDPAGKFAQALNKLMIKLDSKKSKLLETSSIKEFRELHSKGHFPGLGYIKKLSMKHHIETLASYFH